ncbi:MAG: FtsX-like permease family protein, partial [Gemmatimonadota bacterium]
VLVSLAVAVAFGVGPALAAARRDPAGGLKDGDRGSGARPLVRQALVAGQIALSLALVVGAGLLVRTVRALHSEDLGYATERVLTFSVDVDARGYAEERQREFLRSLLTDIGTAPGVHAAGVATFPILGSRRPGGQRLAPLGREPAEDGIDGLPNFASPGLFSALDIEVVEGRVFDERDLLAPAPEATPSAIVLSESMARELFPDRSAVGELVVAPFAEAPFEVIGVVEDARTVDPRAEPRPAHYFPALARDVGLPTFGWFSFYLRTTADPAGTLASVRRAVRELDPSLPIYDVRTLEQQVDGAIAEERILAGLGSVFALLALLIAAVGLYGVMAYLVSERTREFGIRTALGADARSVLGLVMRQAVAVAGVGVALGVIGATQLTRLIESRLYGVTRLDPMTFALAAAVLAAAVLVASWIPARRATRVDPMVALREE